MKSSCVHIEMVYHVDSNEWCMGWKVSGNNSQIVVTCDAVINCANYTNYAKYIRILPVIAFASWYIAIMFVLSS